jgi:hypothetical protein
MPEFATLSEANLAAIDRAPMRNRTLSNVSAKSVEKLSAMLGDEATDAAVTTVKLGEFHREASRYASPDGLTRQASAVKMMEKTGTAKTEVAVKAEKMPPPNSGACCILQ